MSASPTGDAEAPHADPSIVAEAVKLTMLHIVFGDSAAGTLRMVLKGRGRTDRVASLGDFLDIGPLPEGNWDWNERIAWLDEVAPAPADIGSDWMKASADRFLAEVRSSDDERLIWIAPQSARERCGLQWYFEQFPGAPTGPAIIVDQSLSRGGWRNGPPLGLGELPNDLIAELLDHAPRCHWPDEQASLKGWSQLRAENSLLRIVDDGRLRSAPADHFDTLIVNRCTTEWRKWSTVVARAMIEAMEEGHDTPDIFYDWRICELVKVGVLECRHELPGAEVPNNRRGAEVRRVEI